MVLVLVEGTQRKERGTGREGGREGASERASERENSENTEIELKSSTV